jgi:hypothetical protein
MIGGLSYDRPRKSDLSVYEIYNIPFETPSRLFSDMGSKNEVAVMSTTMLKTRLYIQAALLFMIPILVFGVAVAPSLAYATNEGSYPSLLVLAPTIVLAFNTSCYWPGDSPTFYKEPCCPYDGSPYLCSPNQ